MNEEEVICVTNYGTKNKVKAVGVVHCNKKQKKIIKSEVFWWKENLSEEAMADKIVNFADCKTIEYVKGIFPEKSLLCPNCKKYHYHRVPWIEID